MYRYQELETLLLIKRKVLVGGGGGDNSWLVKLNVFLPFLVTHFCLEINYEKFKMMFF